MFGDSQQLSTQVALYVGEDTSSESRSQNLNSIAWNVQEGNFNLKDLVRPVTATTSGCGRI